MRREVHGLAVQAPAYLNSRYCWRTQRRREMGKQKTPKPAEVRTHAHTAQIYTWSIYTWNYIFGGEKIDQYVLYIYGRVCSIQQENNVFLGFSGMDYRNVQHMHCRGHTIYGPVFRVVRVCRFCKERVDLNH